MAMLVHARANTSACKKEEEEDRVICSCARTNIANIFVEALCRKGLAKRLTERCEKAPTNIANIHAGLMAESGTANPSRSPRLPDQTVKFKQDLT